MKKKEEIMNQVWVVIESDAMLGLISVVGVFKTQEQALKKVDEAKKLPVARWCSLTTIEE